MGPLKHAEARWIGVLSAGQVTNFWFDKKSNSHTNQNWNPGRLQALHFKPGNGSARLRPHTAIFGYLQHATS